MASEQMWIAGEWTDAEDGSTSDVLNPATGEVIATTPKATIADVERCVAASRAALNSKEWGAMDPLKEAVSYRKWLQQPMQTQRVWLQ